MHKLLLADDSITIQRVIELTFSGEDVQVVAVSDGEQAIARIPVERPDIVLADIGMPKRSGYDVAAFVKGDPGLAHIPVLLLAGAFEPVDEARAEQVKCDGVLVKPFEPQQVIARVRSLMSPASSPAARGADAPAESLPKPSEAGAGAPGSAAGDQGRAEAAAHVAPASQQARPRERRTDEDDVALDDYFERLDAAFASLGVGSESHQPPQPPPGDDGLTEAAVPTVDELLASSPPERRTPEPAAAAPPIDLPLHAAESTPAERPHVLPSIVPPPVEAPDTAPTLTPAARPPVVDARIEETDRGAGPSVIADAFTALLAVEQGEPGATPVRIGGRPPAATVVTDELVDEVTRRVLERLTPQAVGDLVAPIVSDVAERLVREEIARIRRS